MDDRKLFRVVRKIVPEWGSARVEFTKYFLASSRDTVKAVVEDRYGKARYYRYDEEELVYEIEECDVEAL